MELAHIPEALRMFKHRLRVGFKGIKRYEGNSRQICEHIIKECWNGEYFMTSSGHFSQFWVRDFGWCVESLMKLGYDKEVKKTLSYAVNIFNKNNKITTAITPNGIPYDFPCYGPDSLAFFIRSLRISNSFDIIKKNKNFLNNEIKKYFDVVIDKDTGLVKKNKRFSSMKDRYYRVSSCYDNVMSAMLKDDLSKIKILNNPFKNYNFKKIIKHNFWTGDYFLDDLESRHVAGDANVIPYWSGVFSNKNMIRKSVDIIIDNNLDKPFPLKYTNKIPKTKKHYTEVFFIPNSEGTSMWTQLGMMYIRVVDKIDEDLAREYINKYKKIIENYKNFIEIFSPKGKPYKNMFYHADAGMLWASMYLGMVT
jgi:hypothetical protein